MVVVLLDDALFVFVVLEDNVVVVLLGGRPKSLGVVSHNFFTIDGKLSTVLGVLSLVDDEVANKAVVVELLALMG